ncbi:adenylate/guanylate cyclase domain-containing protein [bacterium]|nr:adenylate/guanylate cyclase domain-containing protein [bacterium]
MPPEEKVTRKLRAILSADVKGYSLLMSDDEAFTVKTLKSYRALMSEQIEQHTGRVVDAPGDNLLAEFASVVDAVQCAVEIQKILKAKNEDLPTGRRLEFRIGVNIGDVIQDGDSLYGEGVNIAARIEGLADAGGVCISRNAYDHIRNKLNYGYEYLGEHNVKNIETPVRVYKLLMAEEDAGKLVGVKRKISKLKWVILSVAVFMLITVGVLFGLYMKYLYLPAPENIDPEDKLTLNLSKGPSIAVLPFDNMSKDPDQEYFCDGITENIIAVLSHIPKLLVIARNSTFAYKGKPINVQQIGHELGAQYVIEGSIQKSDDRIRITVQLIDTKSGHHMWSERYDRELKDIFKLQDEIAIEIAKAMQIHITEGEITKTRFKNIPDLQTYIKFLKVLEYFHQTTKESNVLARKETEEILALHPEYSAVYTLLGLVYVQGFALGTCESDLICFGKATEAVRKALSLNANNSDAHNLASWIFLMRKEHDKAIAEAKNAIMLNPNNAEAYVSLGWALILSDRPGEAIGIINKAIRLNPIPPAWYLFNLGWAYRVSKQYEKAIETYKKGLSRQSDYWQAYLGLAFSYHFLGREKDARAAVKEALILNPDISIKWLKKIHPYKNQAELERVVEASRKLGVPE